MKVLIDTNFLLLPNQFGIDIYAYLKFFEIFTLSSCVSELKQLSKKKSRDAVAAKVALKLIEQNKVEIVPLEEKNTDKAILNYAVEKNCAVATNDKELIKALKKQHIKIIRLRQSKYLIEE